MEKFNKAQAKNLAAAQKLVNAYASSSEDEGELDEKHILGMRDASPYDVSSLVIFAYFRSFIQTLQGSSDCIQ